MIMEPNELITGNIIQLHRITSNIVLAQKFYEIILANKKNLVTWFEYEHNCQINSLDDSFRYLICLENRWQEQKQFSYFIYTLKNELVGYISANLTEPENCGIELSFWIIKAARQHGYISEAISLIEKIFFFLGIERIVVCCFSECKIVANLALKNHYQFEGVKKHGHWNSVKKKFVDVSVYSKIKSGRLKSDASISFKFPRRNNATF